MLPLGWSFSPHPSFVHVHEPEAGAGADFASAAGAHVIARTDGEQHDQQE